MRYKCEEVYNYRQYRGFMLKKISLLIICSLITQISYSNTCNEVTSVKDKSYDIKHMNGKNLDYNRDQDSTSFCYAYAHADALEQWLRKKEKIGKDDHVSALGIALEYDKQKWNGIFKKLSKFDKIDPNAAKYKNIIINRLDSRENELKVKENQLDQNVKRMYPDKFKERQAFRDKIKKTDSYSKESKELQKNLNKLIEKQRKEISSKSRLFKYKLKKITQLKAEIKKLNDDYDKYKDMSIYVPRGGISSQLKYSSNICFENELSSSDNALKDYYNKHLEEFKKRKLLFYPKNLEDGVGYIASKRYINASNCNLYEVINSIMPNIPLTMNEFNNLLSKMKKDDNIFEQLMKVSCSKKDDITSNLPSTTFARRPIQNIEKNISDALKSGKIAMVGYRPVVLSKNIGRHSLHASTIIGEIKLCNSPYYVLKNSWGSEACKKNRKGFLKIDQDYKDKQAKFHNELQNCSEDGKKKALNQIRNNCKIYASTYLLCKEKYEKEMESNEASCSQKYMKAIDSISKNNKTPFYCDEKGNYIIEKNHFLKGATGAGHING